MSGTSPGLSCPKSSSKRAAGLLLPELPESHDLKQQQPPAAATPLARAPGRAERAFSSSGGWCAATCCLPGALDAQPGLLLLRQEKETGRLPAPESRHPPLPPESQPGHRLAGTPLQLPPASPPASPSSSRAASFLPSQRAPPKARGGGFPGAGSCALSACPPPHGPLPLQARSPPPQHRPPPACRSAGPRDSGCACLPLLPRLCPAQISGQPLRGGGRERKEGGKGSCLLLGRRGEAPEELPAAQVALEPGDGGRDVGAAAEFLPEEEAAAAAAAAGTSRLRRGGGRPAGLGGSRWEMRSSEAAPTSPREVRTFLRFRGRPAASSSRLRPPRSVLPVRLLLGARKLQSGVSGGAAGLSLSLSLWPLPFIRARRAMASASATRLGGTQRSSNPALARPLRPSEGALLDSCGRGTPLPAVWPLWPAGHLRRLTPEGLMPPLVPAKVSPFFV